MSDGLLTTLWGLGVLTSMVLVWDYGAAPGVAADPPASWPVESDVPRDPERMQLVLLAHPRCPCTRATLAELARLLPRAAERPATTVLFGVPPGDDPAWLEGELWDRARDLPDVRVLADPNGREAARFGATTSGQALLFDRDGRRLLATGLTATRGHEGASSGGRALLEALAGRHAPGGLPALGCPLVSPCEPAGS